jgi:hypothetical protein
MSQSDKTRQKLVDSMRKTKSGATGKDDSAAADEPKKTETQAQAPKTTTAPKAKPAAAKQTDKSKAATSEGDGYQSARRRVWPD